MQLYGIVLVHLTCNTALKTRFQTTRYIFNYRLLHVTNNDMLTSMSTLSLNSYLDVTKIV